jgi:hypothetical protein
LIWLQPNVYYASYYCCCPRCADFQMLQPWSYGWALISIHSWQHILITQHQSLYMDAYLLFCKYFSFSYSVVYDSVSRFCVESVSEWWIKKDVNGVTDILSCIHLKGLMKAMEPLVPVVCELVIFLNDRCINYYTNLRLSQYFC